MAIEYPIILKDSSQIVTVDSVEQELLKTAAELLTLGHPKHSLNDIWTAAAHNLRRRVEVYGVDLFNTAVSNIPGRKKYDSSGDTLEDKWADVDDAVLIQGCTQLGILSAKAQQALSMINWFRNHASAAHLSNESATDADVIGLVLILQENLFNLPMPEIGHSPAALFGPVKNSQLSIESIETYKDQIKSFKNKEIITIFGFLLDLICKGDEPSLSNAKQLFPTAWEKADEATRKTAGERYNFLLNQDYSDPNLDRTAKTRIVELLINVHGIQYIPDGARARLYRFVVRSLAVAKDSGYGWGKEEQAAKELTQLGTYVPSVAFEDVYQEIVSVWCGNYWGRSSAYLLLQPFIDCLNSTQICELANLFETNDRIKNELYEKKPKIEAIKLLQELKKKLTIQSHLNELDRIIGIVQKY